MRRRGHIEKRGDAWRIYVDLGRDPVTKKRQRIRHTFHGTEKQAQAELTRLLREVDTQTYVEPSKLTFGQYLDQWMRDSVQVSVRLTSASWYRLIVDVHLKPKLGKIPLTRLSAIDLQRYYAEAVNSLAPVTVKGHHRVIHRALEEAMQLGLILSNPTDRVKPPKVEKKEMQALTEEEVAKLLDVAKTTRHYAMFLTAVSLGLRSGELLGLKWSDINWEAGTITIQRTLLRTTGDEPQFGPPKKRAHTVKMGKTLLEALKAHKARQNEERLGAGPQWHDNGLVFTWEDGRPIRGAYANRLLKKLLGDAGLPSIRFHDLRHTAATILIGRGVHSKFVSDLLGHADISTTLGIYSHIQPHMQDELASVMDAVLSGRRRNERDS